MKVTLKIDKDFDVKYLKAEVEPRYWEDSSVNGVNDGAGNLVPCRKGDVWSILIDVDSGFIVNWPQGKTADIHYKVCDKGVYSLLDIEKNLIVEKDGYAPDCLCPKDSGYGDYVIMDIDADGKIDNWNMSFDEFQNEE